MVATTKEQGPLQPLGVFPRRTAGVGILLNLIRGNLGFDITFFHIAFIRLSHDFSSFSIDNLYLSSASSQDAGEAFNMFPV